MKKKTKLYLLPGLGFDERIFERLDLSSFDHEFINWIEPLSKETIESYAERMAAPIVDEDNEIVLIGHSMGGVIAQEIACLKTIKTVVLLSSVKSEKELPFYFKLVKWLQLHTFFVKWLAIYTVWIWGRYHDFVSKADKALLKSMVAKNSNSYLKWALKTLARWKSPVLPSHTQLIQLHGTKDRTFFYKKIEQPHIAVAGGSHIMLYQQAVKVNSILNDKLGINQKGLDDDIQTL